MIFSQDLLTKFRNSEQDFTRKSPLSFPHLILYFLNFCKNSYQDELDHFFTILEDSKFLFRKVSKAALSQARAKLDAKVFQYLIQKSQEFIEKNFPLETWQGFRLFAIDGSTLYLNQNTETLDYFGFQTNQHNKKIAMARLSQCFDVLNGLTQDIQLSPYSTGERSLFQLHCKQLPQDSLVLLDRGYPSYLLFHEVLQQNQNFVARTPIDFNKDVKAFYESNQEDQLTTFPLPQGLSGRKDLPQELSVRLIKVQLDNETEILVTSLIDSKHYTLSIFQDLYSKRWPVEEDYKKIKSSIQVENFSGKSVHSIYQDVYAKVLSKNITVALMNPLKEEVEEKNKSKKHAYTMNLNHALSKMKHSIIRLLTGQSIQECLESLHKLWTKTLEPIRKGRKYYRIRKWENRFPINCKPLC